MEIFKIMLRDISMKNGKNIHKYHENKITIYEQYIHQNCII